MLPIVLDGSRMRAGVAGAGDGLRRRLNVLAAAGVKDPVIFANGVPSAQDIAGLTVLFIAGLDEGRSRDLAGAARQAGVLVNVEDVPALCDFHVPAQVRRGDLVLTVSTGGRSPGLSRALRENLEERFGPEWDRRLDEIAVLREQWRSEGVGAHEISQRTRGLVAERGWLA
jgi:precorrin-2 dehydrogenase / sirohydrochlorin ferrochelatase